jgi:hypothetical protein
MARPPAHSFPKGTSLCGREASDRRAADSRYMPLLPPPSFLTCTAQTDAATPEPASTHHSNAAGLSHTRRARRPHVLLHRHARAAPFEALVTWRWRVAPEALRQTAPWPQFLLGHLLRFKCNSLHTSPLKSSPGANPTNSPAGCGGGAVRTAPHVRVAAAFAPPPPAAHPA